MTSIRRRRHYVATTSRHEPVEWVGAYLVNLKSYHFYHMLIPFGK